MGPDQQYYLGAVNCTDGTDGAWYVILKLGSNSVKFKIDTGADVTVISKATYEALQDRPTLKPPSISLTSPGGKVNAIGEFTASAEHKGATFRFRVVVINGKRDNLLARQVASKMGMVARIDEMIQESACNAIGLLKTAPVMIKLKDDVELYCQTVSRRVPFPLMEAVKEELERMKRNDIIKPVTEPTDWCSAMVPVVKRNGKIRICVDLKALNSAVKHELYSIPTLERVTPHLVGSTDRKSVV
jgi:hypothetical protein